MNAIFGLIPCPSTLLPVMYRRALLFNWFNVCISSINKKDCCDMEKVRTSFYLLVCNKLLEPLEEAMNFK